MIGEVDAAKDTLGVALRKEFIFLIPLLGSALAITYDVGYFAGVGGSFFTLFSLNEHIVFALQALPIALFAATALVLFLHYLDRRFIRLVHKRSPVIFWSVLVLSALTLLAVSTVLLPWSAFALMMLSVSCASLPVSPWMAPVPRAIFASFAAAMFTFSFGYAVAVRSVQTPDRLVPNMRALATIETKSGGGAIQGKILRSGERGLLIFEPDKKRATMLRWDEIKQISRTY